MKLFSQTVLVISVFLLSSCNEAFIAGMATGMADGLSTPRPNSSYESTQRRQEAANQKREMANQKVEMENMRRQLRNQCRASGGVPSGNRCIATRTSRPSRS